MICPAKLIVYLAKENPLKSETGNDVDAHVTILAKRLPNPPKLPIYVPSIEK